MDSFVPISSSSERGQDCRPLPKLGTGHVLWLMIVACLFWAVIVTVASANLDRYDDMLENYAWAWPLVWGTHKHPPFFSWVVAGWFHVMPNTDLAYRLLAYANVGVGLWGVRALGRRLGMQGLANWGALLLLWTIPYTNMASKFNANTQLLSLWPWTAAMLLASWSERGWRGVWFSAWLGVTAAACVLSKYFSALLLVGFLVPTVLHAQGRAWLRTSKPYLAVLIFLLVLAPHIAWLHAHGWPTVQYAMDQGFGQRDWSHLLRFALAPLFYWLPAWLLIVLFWALRHAQRSHSSFHRTAVYFLGVSWLPNGVDDVLFWLAFMPWALTLGFGLSAVVELSTPWALPVGYAFSLLWLRNLNAVAPTVADDVLQLCKRLWWPMLALVVSLGLSLTVIRAMSGSIRYYRPTQVAAKQIMTAWQNRHPGETLKWVGGEWAANAMLSFYAQPRLRTFPSVPGSPEASAYGISGQRPAGPGLLLCQRGTAGGAEISDCEIEVETWLADRGLPRNMHLVTAQRTGWRFPQPIPFSYVVFDVDSEEPTGGG